MIAAYVVNMVNLRAYLQKVNFLAYWGPDDKSQQKPGVGGTTGENDRNHNIEREKQEVGDGQKASSNIFKRLVHWIR